MNYVCGFMMSYDLMQFLLIRKTHPDWQKGKLNGIGGKIETHLINEVTKQDIVGWQPGDAYPIPNEDPMFEVVSSYSLLDFFFTDSEDTIYNVPYLIRMIIDNWKNGTFVQLNPQGVNNIP